MVNGGYDERENGSYGGRKENQCPRCGKQRDTIKKGRRKGEYIHQVPEITNDNENLINTVGEIMLTVQGDSTLFPNLEAAAFMLGVLEVTIGGKTNYFATTSGQNYLRRRHLQKVSYKNGRWEICYPPRPDAYGRWNTVAGHKAGVPPEVHRWLGTRYCAAMRLLVQVATSNPNHALVTGLSMCEMAYVGKKSTDDNFRQWHGENSSTSWTAHSCQWCMELIPYLICTLAPNEFDPQ
jgi:hypothetical protein